MAVAVGELLLCIAPAVIARGRTPAAHGGAPKKKPHGEAGKGHQEYK